MSLHFLLACKPTNRTTLFHYFIFQVFFPIPTSPQRCLTVGTHPVYGTNCTKAINCGWNNTSRDTYQRSFLYCINNTFFNPRSQKCQAGYFCLDRICKMVGGNKVESTLYMDVNNLRCTTYFTCRNDNNVTHSVLNICEAGYIFVRYENVLEGSCELSSNNTCIPYPFL